MPVKVNFLDCVFIRSKSWCEKNWSCCTSIFRLIKKSMLPSFSALKIVLCIQGSSILIFNEPPNAYCNRWMYLKCCKEVHQINQFVVWLLTNWVVKLFVQHFDGDLWCMNKRVEFEMMKIAWKSRKQGGVKVAKPSQFYQFSLGNLHSVFHEKLHFQILIE